MPTLNSDPVTDDTLDRIIQAIRELDPKEPFSPARLASHAQLDLKEALMGLLHLTAVGLIDENWLYRNPQGKFEPCGSASVLTTDPSRLWARFEVTPSFRGLPA